MTVLVGFLKKFTVLRGAPRELWIVFFGKAVGIVAYSLMNTTFVLWLSKDLGYSDERAGFLVGAWSTVMTLLAVFVGSLTDAIGLRRAYLLGLTVCVVSRAVMTFTTVKWLALAGGMLPLALGEALGVPVLVAAVRRYSTTAQRSISFALFYALMNFGFLIANYLFDRLREIWGEYGHFTLPILGLHFTTYRLLFLTSFLVELALLPIVYFVMREGVEATEEGVTVAPERATATSAGLRGALGLMIRDALRETIRIFAGLWRQPGFYKFLAFLGLAALLRLIFIHMYYTYPKFGIRELGEGAPVGRLFAVNSALIVVLVPIVGALTQKIAAYRMVTVGSGIAAASVFLMAAPPSWFEPLADGRLGHAIANTWLGGDLRFSPDDLRDLPSLAGRLEAPGTPSVAAVKASLSEVTLALLARARAVGTAGWPRESHPSSVLVAPSDLLDFDALVARLRNEGNPTSPPAFRFMWDHFSQETRAALEDPSRPARLRQALLLAELNHLLYREQFVSEQLLVGVPVSAATQALLNYREHSAEKTKGGRPDARPPPAKSGEPPATARATTRPELPRTALPNATQLLNRLVLEDRYPGLIAPSLNPLRVALAADLTSLLRSEALADKPAFLNLARPDSAGTRRAEKLAGARLIRANRRLIEDTFPTEIAKNRVGEQRSVNPYYVMIFLFVVLLSIGESFYSPRLYEYAAAIAPKGQEASYMSLSYLPFFLAKLLVSTFSGVLLGRFCPETGARHSEVLWLIIALTTLIAPIGLITLQRFIRVPEAGREG